MRRTMALVVLLAACGTADGSSDSTATSTAPSSTTTAAPADEAATPSEQQIGLFVANLIETLGPTGYAASVEQDPLPFVTTGAIMCELMGEGVSPAAVVGQFLDSFGPDPSDDDSALAGALLGSAVNAFCPEHRALLVDDLG